MKSVFRLLGLTCALAASSSCVVEAVDSEEDIITEEAVATVVLPMDVMPTEGTGAAVVGQHTITPIETSQAAPRHDDIASDPDPLPWHERTRSRSRDDSSAYANRGAQ